MFLLSIIGLGFNNTTRTRQRRGRRSAGSVKTLFMLAGVGRCEAGGEECSGTDVVRHRRRYVGAPEITRTLRHLARAAGFKSISNHSKRLQRLAGRRMGDSYGEGEGRELKSRRTEMIARGTYCGKSGRP